jgi:hypothetical protein
MNNYDNYPLWAKLSIEEWEQDLADGIMGFMEFNERVEELEEQLLNNGYYHTKDDYEEYNV